jgi:Protein of unknown function (DUF4244)
MSLPPRMLRPGYTLPWRHQPSPDDGMSTAEYAIGTIAAAAFAAVLYAVVTGDSVVSGLTSLIQRALSVSF